MRKGFTLLELIVVIIIVGILATVGFTQYTRVVEKGRTAEAKMILGQIRTTQVAYRQEHEQFAGAMAELPLDLGGAVDGACDANHYFSYSTDSSGLGTANRCASGAGGKNPGADNPYTITLTVDSGVWDGDTAGYY